MPSAAAEMVREVFREERLAADLRSDSLAIAASRASPNALAEYAFRDRDTDQPLRQAPHHRALHEIFDEHRRAIVWYPVDHGKTTQVVIRLCWLLGNHPDRQYAYVSSKALQARKVVATVGREILTNERLHRVFPGLKPERASHSAALECWGDAALRVDGCPPGAKDPSLAAHGLDGQIIGSRLHGVFIDNAMDRDNTASRVVREKAVEIVDAEIVTRVLADGFVAITDTSWTVDDAPHEIAKRPGWYSQKFDAHASLDGGVSLWPERYPPERLAKIAATISKPSYDRQYRNIPLSESIGVFRDEAMSRAWGRVPWCETLAEALPDEADRSDAAICTGVDLATRRGEEHDLTVLSTVMRVGHRFRLLHLRAERMEGAAIMSAMLETYRRFHVGAGAASFLVEDNAAQVYIVQLCRTAEVLSALGATPDELARIRVMGRTTTAKKRDLELGIPSLAGDLDMGRWDIPAHHETEQLREEMKAWTPDGHTGDRLMAMWFARDGLLTVPDPQVDFI